MRLQPSAPSIARRPRRPRRPAGPAERGFTFVELMTSVIVAAVLLAVAVPGLAQFIRNSRVSSASRNWCLR